MKNIIMNNKKWTSVVLLGLATLTYSHTHTNDLSTEMVKKVIIPYVHNQTNMLASFFDHTKNTASHTWKKHSEHLDIKAKEYGATVERYKRTPTHITPLFALTLRLALYIEEKFSPLLCVIRKYVGKKDFLNFVADLKKVLEKDRIFKEITEYLEELSQQAKAENNVPMMDAAEDLKKILKMKTIEWTSKSDNDLLKGIITRMKH